MCQCMDSESRAVTRGSPKRAPIVVEWGSAGSPHKRLRPEVGADRSCDDFGEPCPIERCDLRPAQDRILACPPVPELWTVLSTAPHP